MERTPMTTHKLTVKMLEGIPYDRSRTFILPDSRALAAAKSLAAQYGPHLACRFAVQTDMASNTIVITRNRLES